MGELVHLRRPRIVGLDGEDLFRIKRRGNELCVGVKGNQRALRCPSAGRARAVELLATKLHRLLPALEVDALLGYVDNACDADAGDGPARQPASEHLAWAQGWTMAARAIEGDEAAAAWAWSIAVRRLLWGLFGA